MAGCKVVEKLGAAWWGGQVVKVERIASRMWRVSVGKLEAGMDEVGIDSTRCKFEKLRAQGDNSTHQLHYFL